MFNRHGKPVGIYFFNSSKNHDQAKKSYEILFENTTQTVRVDNSQSMYEVELSGERFTLDRDKLEQLHQENMANIDNRKKKAEDEYLSSLNEVVADKVRKSHRSSEGHSEEN